MRMCTSPNADVVSEIELPVGGADWFAICHAKQTVACCGGYVTLAQGNPFRQDGFGFLVKKPKQ